MIYMCSTVLSITLTLSSLFMRNCQHSSLLFYVSTSTKSHPHRSMFLCQSIQSFFTCCACSYMGKKNTPLGCEVTFNAQNFKPYFNSLHEDFLLNKVKWRILKMCCDDLCFQLRDHSRLIMRLSFFDQVYVYLEKKVSKKMQFCYQMC